MKYCDKCGNQIDGANYCVKCGANFQQMSKPKYFKYTFSDFGKGGTATIEINNNTLTITRKGLMSKMAHGLSGQKTIMLNQITGVQIKKVGITRGYIQFLMAGHEERHSGVVTGSLDENIVYSAAYLGKTNKAINNAFETIKKMIEDSHNNPISNTTIINQNSKYDDLSKIKKLYDDGILSEEEFNNEKNKILSK